MKKKNCSKKGNALFIILIAVALFAALSYAVTQSGRGGGTINKEQTLLDSSEIIQIAGDIRAAINRLRLINGCSETDFSFDNATSATSYINTSSPIDNSCDLFDSNGGGLTYISPKPSWLDQSQSAELFFGDILFSGRTCVRGVPNTSEISCGGDANNTELTMIIPFISRDLCISLNKGLDVDNATDNLIEQGGDAWSGSLMNFTGTYYSSNSGIDITTVSERGKRTFCFDSTTANFPASNTFHFVQVLIDRD